MSLPASVGSVLAGFQLDGAFVGALLHPQGGTHMRTRKTPRAYRSTLQVVELLKNESADSNGAAAGGPYRPTTGAVRSGYDFYFFDLRPGDSKVLLALLDVVNRMGTKDRVDGVYMRSVSLLLSTLMTYLPTVRDVHAPHVAEKLHRCLVGKHE